MLDDSAKLDPIMLEIFVEALEDWHTNAPYFWGDYVRVWGRRYRCIEAHRSRIFANDLHRGAWVLESR